MLLILFMLHAIDGSKNGLNKVGGWGWGDFWLDFELHTIWKRLCIETSCTIGA